MNDLQDLVDQSKKVESISDLFSLLRQTLIAMATDLPGSFPARKTVVRSMYRTNQAMTKWESSKVFPRPGTEEKDLPGTKEF